MNTFRLDRTIEQLEARQGGYFYLRIEAELVDRLSRKRATRLICTLDDAVTYRCGLNHLGDGNYFLILAKKQLAVLQKKAGDGVRCDLREDPNPLGVEVPEVLEALLAQDDELHRQYHQLTDGKKRGLIHSMNQLKDLDRQVQIAVAILTGVPRREAVRKKNT